jgi:hypothetical protein
MLVALVLGSAAWMPTAGPVHRPCAHHRPGQRVLTTVQANFFNQAKVGITRGLSTMLCAVIQNICVCVQEMIDYKMRHVGTMATVQHVVVGSFDELNQIEAEVKAAGVTEEAMADAAAKYSLDKGSAAKGGVVGPFMLGQKEFAFEKVRRRLTSHACDQHTDPSRAIDEGNALLPCLGVLRRRRVEVAAMQEQCGLSCECRTP